MTWSLARHLFGLACVSYALIAAYEASRAGDPIEVDWIIKVAGLFLLGLAIGVVPECSRWVQTNMVLPRIHAPTIFNPDIIPMPAFIQPQTPATAFVTPSVPRVQPAEADPDPMREAVVRTQLIVSLLNSTKDPTIVEALMKLSDSTFREAFKSKLPKGV